ncbi:MAG: hypothetical protein ACJAQ6_001289, partial [Arenicella sp.]
MVVDHNDNFVTQRKFSKMCLIGSQLIDGDLFVSADGKTRCKVPAGGHTQRRSSVWGSDVIGEDCGQEAADWISEFLATACRIIYMRE